MVGAKYLGKTDIYKLKYMNWTELNWIFSVKFRDFEELHLR